MSDRVITISSFSLLQSSTVLRHFIAMINFFRPMIEDLAKITFTVTELLHLNPNAKILQWTKASNVSFNNLKQELPMCRTLSFPSLTSTHCQLVTDSSSVVVGATLYKTVNSEPTQLEFYSKKLSDAQKVHPTYDHEVWATSLDVLHFQTLIDWHTVTLFLDHKPIVLAFRSKSVARSDRHAAAITLANLSIFHQHIIYAVMITL